MKWDNIVLALKTKFHVSRSDRERNHTIQNVQNKLNELGEGWDLVSVQNVRLETKDLFTVAYLKREKS